MSLKDIVEEYGGMIFGMIAFAVILTGVLTQLSPGGFLYQLIEKIMITCAGGA